MTTISAIANNGIHITLWITDTSPLPFIFNTISENYVKGLKISSTVKCIDQIRFREILEILEGYITLILVKLKVDCSTSHGLYLVSRLEPSKVSANLPSPLTTRLICNISSVC